MYLDFFHIVFVFRMLCLISQCYYNKVIVVRNLRFQKVKFVCDKQTLGYLITRLYCNPNKFLIFDK